MNRTMSRYVVHYRGTSDPSATEERSLLSSLKNAKIIDRMPGALLVDALDVELEELAKKFKKWRFVPEVSVKVNPPRKRIVNSF